MNERRQNRWAKWQPAFLICTAVLAGAGVGMSWATQRLGLCLHQEPLPLRKPLGELVEAKLTPYTVATKTTIENPEILKSLGTTDYIQWLLEDPREPVSSPVRRLLLFVTYYGQADRVPHVPEECYTGGGYQRLATDAISFHVAGEPHEGRGPSLVVCPSGHDQEAPHGVTTNRLADSPREIPGRYLLFEKTTSDVVPAMRRFPVLYLFRVNGEYAGSRDEARLALNKNLFSRHSYFCKIEMAFNQSSVAPTREAAAAAGERLLTVLLPLLEREHWPDLE